MYSKLRFIKEFSFLSQMSSLLSEQQTLNRGPVSAICELKTSLEELQFIELGMSLLCLEDISNAEGQGLFNNKASECTDLEIKEEDCLEPCDFVSEIIRSSPVLENESTKCVLPRNLPLVELLLLNTKEYSENFTKRILTSVWKMIATHSYAGPFMAPVREKKAPGYKEIIKRPKDLKTIKKSLSRQNIRTTVEFQRDVLLMLQNCIMYNNVEYIIHQKTLEMQKDVVQLLQEKKTVTFLNMANNVISPGLGILSDDEESPVFESTSADCAAGIRKDLLNEFSVISPGLGHPSQSMLDEGPDKVMVYVRIRPFVDEELDKKEDQGCVVVENQETLILRAPKDSFTMKNTERGMGQSVHKFTFSQIFGPEVDQKQFFDGTMRRVVKDALNGQNWLVYTYGVTNSGKTYTIQGTNKDGGILPRSIALIFNSAQDRLYKSSDLKPLSNEVIWLDSKQVRQEELKKVSLLVNLREEELMTPMKRSGGDESQLRGGTSISFDSGIGGLSSTSHANQTSIQLEETCSRWGEQQDAISLQEPSDIQLSIWVAYFEIYNEFVYDLLEPMSSGPNRKRTTLRLCEDRNGNPYVKDLNWINVHSADEAWKVLRVGRKNQSFASTHLNQNSSRSHSIFCIRILHMQGKHDMTPKISELSFCDLAGSERCKDQRSGDRMKEATNINTSLHTLGRCINALRQNQQNKLRQNVVPFRDSKLTRVFQAYFTGRGKSCMIVNINQCASTYDETLHAMKFSAIASQLVQAPVVKINMPSIQSLIKESSILANRSYTDDEEGSDEESDSETDITMFNKEELLQVIENMKQLVVKERQEKLAMEMTIRKEVCSEMMEMMQQQKSQYGETMEDERELLEEMYEERLENLKESLTNYYKRELKERDEHIEELQAALEEAKDVPDALNTTKTKKDIAPLRRSKRLAVSDTTTEVATLKMEIAELTAELKSKNEEIERLKVIHEPPSSAKTFTADVDRKIQEGQKNVRLLRTEMQKFGESLQQMDRACCHTTGAEKLRQALGTCDEILGKQEKTLAELQNNMALVKMDLRKKTACIAEQYHTVQRLQGTPSGFKRMCNNENVQPNQPTEKRPFLRNLLSRTPGQKALLENSPYSRVLRARRSPVLKTVAFGTKY
ncbi:kinesin-like protein KIF20A isoform X2 [Pyxicephalus adspersus]|uniref:kinesin-like protein KIF20A isoform X2 n=1 Tax=Pyxicephalus adspersus TaxID=30357 RepID=UPI003B5CF5D8